MNDSIKSKYNKLQYEVNRFAFQPDLSSQLSSLYDIKYAIQLLEEELKREVGIYHETY